MAEEQEDKSSKSQEATPQKLKKAREQGDVPSSQEVGMMMTVVSLLALTVFILPAIGPQLAGILKQMLEISGTARIGEGVGGVRDIGSSVTAFAGRISLVLAPVLGVFVVAAIVGVAIQGETVFAVERIRPKFSKLSPAKGLTRIFSGGALVEFLKSVAKVLVVGTLAVWLTYVSITEIWQTENFLPEFLLGYVQGFVQRLLLIVAIFAVVIALIDVIVKRVRWLIRQRMSVKEVRDEHKDQEGDPMIKGKRNQIRRQNSRRRVAAAVSEATVVLTNPTHYAVVLKYEPGADSAPVCTAKGVELMAAQIRRLAHEAEVPVVENRPLARALYSVAQVDEVIPVEHWQAVAGIIRYILDMRANIETKLPEGSTLRDD